VRGIGKTRWQDFGDFQCCGVSGSVVGRKNLKVDCGILVRCWIIDKFENVDIRCGVVDSLNFGIIIIFTDNAIVNGGIRVILI